MWVVITNLYANYVHQIYRNTIRMEGVEQKNKWSFRILYNTIS